MPVLRPIKGDPIEIADYPMMVEVGGRNYYLHPEHDHRRILFPYRDGPTTVKIGDVVSRWLSSGVQKLYFVPVYEVPVSDLVAYIPV